MKCRTLLAVAAIGFLAQAAAADQPVARVPLVPERPDEPILAKIFDGVRARGAEPLNMHRALGQSPKVFQAYVGMAYALRADATVPRAYRELIIMRTAQLAGGDYEWAQHRPMALSCGLTPAQIDAIATWRDNGRAFDDRQRAVLAYADGIASKDGVDDRTYGDLKRHFTDREIVELTLTAAFYTAASLTTRALAIQLEPGAGTTSAYGKC